MTITYSRAIVHPPGTVGPADAMGSVLPRHRGRFGAEQARRLLWRAGFGPRPGQAERLGALGLDGAVHALDPPRLRADHACSHQQ